MARRSRQRRWWKGLASFTAFLFGLFVWIDVLLPYVVTAAEGRSFGELLSELLSPENSIYSGKFFYGYFFIALTLVSVIGLLVFSASLFDYLKKSTTDLTIIEANLKYEFVGNSLDRLRLQRTVFFHANRDAVEAYYFTHDSENGQIDVNSFETNSYLDGENITERILETVKTPTRFEGFEMYKRVLPTNVFATLLPPPIVRAFFSLGIFFRGVVVERKGSITYENDHSHPTPYVNVRSANPISLLNLSIDFPQQFAPPLSNFHCHAIRNTTVKAVPCRREQRADRVSYYFTLGDLEGEFVQVAWDALPMPPTPPPPPRPGP